MTEPDPGPTEASTGPASVDDWEHHWAEYAEATSDNPAHAYRRELITSAVEQRGVPKRLLDIGSGQGDLLVSLHARWPAAELAGIELSAEGIRTSAEKVPEAQFFQLDLLQTAELPATLEGWADVAVCSEVLEHVDRPAKLLQVAAHGLAPGGLLVVTVPGGPRTAFDRYIGHRRHYRRKALESVLVDAGLQIERLSGAGLPFFNLYRLVVLARGKALVRDISSSAEPSRLAARAMRAFGLVLRPSLNSSRFGWQMVAVARRPLA